MMENFWREVDWSLFYRQKLEVLKILEEYREEKDGTINQERIDLLEGLVGLLDALGDTAEEKGLFTYPDCEEEAVKLDLMGCIDLISQCIKADILTLDPKDSNAILVYRHAGDKNHPEGWYSSNIMKTAAELVHDLEGQRILAEALNEKSKS